MLSLSTVPAPEAAVSETRPPERLQLVPALQLSERRVEAGWKRLFDVAMAAALLLALSPLFLLVVCLIKLTSRGPVLFRQPRVGHRCREFEMLKFRSMYDGANLDQSALQEDELHGCFFKLKADPRITPLGKWLRRSSLDELPQLWNVLRGEMSLVGPRPVLTSEFRRTPALARHRRFRVKPGMTGLWQVSGRSNCSDEERLRLDSEYTRRRSFLFDLKILFKTLPAVVSGDGAY